MAALFPTASAIERFAGSPAPRTGPAQRFSSLMPICFGAASHYESKIFQARRNEEGFALKFPESVFYRLSELNNYARETAACLDAMQVGRRSGVDLHVRNFSRARNGALRFEAVAGWIAPVTTMIAAMVTAAYLDARVEGWGFVAFTFGSVAWSIVGLGSGQTNLLATNGFLTLVNLMGVWRWLGKTRAYEEGVQSATETSRYSAHPILPGAAGLAGMPVKPNQNESIGKGVEAMVASDNGTISLISDRTKLRRGRAWFGTLPALADGDWRAAPALVRGAGA